MGTHNTVNRMFHVVAVQAYFTKKEFTVDPKFGLLGKSCSVYAVLFLISVME